jgi:diguanylate cyclase (GGDEF)-like protein
MSVAPEVDAARIALLALGTLVAVLAVYVAFDLARRVRSVPTPVAVRWLAGAGIAFGTGFWSLHVLSLAAEPLPFAVGHHPLATFAIWALASALGAIGLGAASERAVTCPRLVASALLLGLAVAIGQAASLNALGLLPGIAWKRPLLAAAAGVTMLGTLAACALTYRARSRPRRQVLAAQTAAAGVLAGALVAGQQLVLGSAGLAGQAGSVYAHLVSSSTLAVLASLGSVAMLLVALLLSVLEAHLRISLRVAEGELQRQSLHDPLTRLPNRLLFESELTAASHHAETAQERFAVLFVDLDAFKPVNETLGHHGGDRVLRAVGSRLKAHTKSKDLVAHLGADEFLMLLRGPVQAEDIGRLAPRLLEAIRQPCRVGGREAAVSCSIGVALFPEHGPAASLIAHAEAAMRAAKANGGAGWCLFEPRLMNGQREQVELLHDLRGALALGQFELYYQPKIHAPSGEITGAEALLRWHHPQRGIVGPAVFIPIAERFGLIGEMGNWVIDEACRQARAWRDQGLLMRVAVNLSVHQLRNPDLVEKIAAAVREHQVNPRLLTFEVTESVAMDDADGAIATFEKLSAAGVHISIDDFGTGYSSLAYLRKLRAVELKIDRSFVLDLESSSDARAVVDAVIKLAQALGLKVVAEGVETEEQHLILRSLGCDELQGYLFAKPMPAKALAVWAIEDVGPRALDFRDSLYQATSSGALH